jgi:hypothetical protein
MRQQSFAKVYDPPLRALLLLSSQKPVAGLITSLQSWAPKNCTAREFEMISFLGPFLRPSVLYEDDVSLLFPCSTCYFIFCNFFVFFFFFFSW